MRFHADITLLSLAVRAVPFQAQAPPLPPGRGLVMAVGFFPFFLTEEGRESKF